MLLSRMLDWHERPDAYKGMVHGAWCMARGAYLVYPFCRNQCIDEFEDSFKASTRALGCAHQLVAGRVKCYFLSMEED